MKKLTFDYYMQIDYSETVSSCHFTIKCLPKETLRQRAENVKVLLSPDVPYSMGRDSFGNAQIYGWDDVAHTTFSFRLRVTCTRDWSAGRSKLMRICWLFFDIPTG